jgi:hypothetical protein
MEVEVEKSLNKMLQLESEAEFVNRFRHFITGIDLEGLADGAEFRRLILERVSSIKLNTEETTAFTQKYFKARITESPAELNEVNREAEAKNFTSLVIRLSDVYMGLRESTLQALYEARLNKFKSELGEKGSLQVLVAKFKAIVRKATSKEGMPTHLGAGLAKLLSELDASYFRNLMIVKGKYEKECVDLKYKNEECRLGLVECKKIIDGQLRRRSNE